MFIINLGDYYLFASSNFSADLTPHLGILFVAGLFFGPYGALGAVVANAVCDIIRGYNIPTAFVSEIFSLIISYLAYKLWYTRDFGSLTVTKPRLTNMSNLIYLILISFVCSVFYSLFMLNTMEAFYPETIDLHIIALRYFVNFMNFSLLFSMIFLIIARYKDFSYMPKVSDKSYKLTYRVLFAIIIITTSVFIILNHILGMNNILSLFELIVLLVLLIMYNTKPITEIVKINYTSIPEKIMISFIILSFIIVLVDRLIIYSPLPEMIFDVISGISENQMNLFLLQFLDLTIFAFAVPSMILLAYIERKLIKPVISFSKIDGFIKENEKIESEGLLDIYSDYLENDDEMGILSRSYTNLINNNNNYIENVKSLESEKERINTELNIAHKIQESTLPKKSINNDALMVEGFCKPAKEVGGDFYDFYELDEENTVIIIGDASGKGVPAAIFTIIIQNSIKLLMKNKPDPAMVLYDVNNQICENNPEMMFITLFLGIYNKNTHKLKYANAGHNPPLVKYDGVYELLDVDSEIVMGVMDNYEYKNHEVSLEDEIILYTDGITDANNTEHEIYGEERLTDFLNNHESGENIIMDLIIDINKFTNGEKQFDDMTLLILDIK